MTNQAKLSDRDTPIDSSERGSVALYRFFDAQSVLLYVGITETPAERWAHHRTHAAATWWPLATTKRVQWFASRDEAASAELTAIRTEAPLWNVLGTPQDAPRLQVRRFVEATGGCKDERGRWKNSDVGVAMVLSEEIRSGTLTAGDPLPSLSAMVNRFSTSARTIRRATQLLIEDRLVIRRGAGVTTRYFVAESVDGEPWRPPPLADGRDALDELLEALRTGPGYLFVAARMIGLPLGVVEGWAQRHPEVRQMMDEAIEESRKRQFRARHPHMAKRPGKGNRTERTTA